MLESNSFGETVFKAAKQLQWATKIHSLGIGMGLDIHSLGIGSDNQWGVPEQQGLQPLAQAPRYMSTALSPSSEYMLIAPVLRTAA